MMDFEFIDEDQIETTRSGRKKKTPSLYDTPLADRSFWGKTMYKDGELVLDPGSQIAIFQTRSMIRRSLRKGLIFDVDDSYPARRLNNDLVEELVQYQIDLLISMVSDGILVAHQDEDENWIIDEVNEDLL